MRSMRTSLAVVVYTVMIVGLPVGNGKSPSEWKSRVVYQILTDRFAKTGDASSPCQDLRDYCGGSYQGIIDKLDYIQGLGANAIWISPIPEQTDKGYHGYWQKNIYNLNEHFGTSDDLKQLVSECHKRDIWVMVDVVANHMGYPPAPGDYKDFVPFNKPEYYHKICDINWSDQGSVEYCQLAYLPDLDQKNSFVRSALKEWVQETVQTYDFDGIRVDTVPEVPKEFWQEYTQAAGVYSIGEVFHSDRNYIARYQGALSGLLNYPMYYRLQNVFIRRNSMREIDAGINDNRNAFKDTSLLGNFLDNHDNKRFLADTCDISILKNGLAYIMFAEGIPFIYYGTEQLFTGGDDPHNRESLWPIHNTNSDLYKFISTLAKFRTKLGATLYAGEHVERYVDDQIYAFTRGKEGEVFVVTTNVGIGQSLCRSFISPNPYRPGTVLVNILDPEDKITVTQDGFIISIKDGLPLVYTPSETSML